MATRSPKCSNGRPVSIDELDARRFDLDLGHLGARALATTIVRTARAFIRSRGHHFALDDGAMTACFTRHEEAVPSHLDVRLSRRIGDLHPATHRLANRGNDTFGAHRLISKLSRFLDQLGQGRGFGFGDRCTKLLLGKRFDHFGRSSFRVQFLFRGRNGRRRGFGRGRFGLGTSTERKSKRGEDEDFPERLHGGRSVPQKAELVTDPDTSLCSIDRPACLNFATTRARMFARAFVAGCLVALSLPSMARAEVAEENVAPGPARPAPFKPLEPAALPVSRHVDVGAAVALMLRAADGQTGTQDSLARYPTAIGWGLSARMQIIRYLRASLYVVRGASSLDLSAGALGLPGNPGPVTVTSYSFGLRLSPTLPLGPRARAWLSAGAGWGRLELGRFDVASAGGTFQVRERAFSFVEFPLGVGISIDIIKNWLAVEYEATGAFHAAQRGTALRNGQAIDTAGHRISVGPFPSIAGSFVQTLGLALVL